MQLLVESRKAHYKSLNTRVLEKVFEFHICSLCLYSKLLSKVMPTKSEDLSVFVLFFLFFIIILFYFSLQPPASLDFSVISQKSR